MENSCPHPLKLLTDASGRCMHCYEIERAVALERERCAKMAESEEELAGPMPDENWVMSQRVRLEDHLRALVRLTKTNIARRIRQNGEVTA